MRNLHLSIEEARQYLTGQLGLRRRSHSGLAGIRALLSARRCIQLDPLDRIGTNAELVMLARTEGAHARDLPDALFPGHAFEHFAKERCLLPASAFPYYRDEAHHPHWWRLTERHRKLDEGLVDAVLDEIRARGPLTAGQLTDRGRVTPMDWSGWKGTGRAATLALEVLWTRCRVVVCGYEGRSKRYDVPERALPTAEAAAPEDVSRWAIRERVEAMGLLPTADGPWWSMLRAWRTSPVIDELVEDGVLTRVRIGRSRRTWLGPADLSERRFPEDDGEMKLLGPLDPLLWDRKLVKQVFGFEYVWEVYKPRDKRIWGYYVCPLLHRGRLVGRVEGARVSGRLEVVHRWGNVDEEAFARCWERHAEAVLER